MPIDPRRIRALMDAQPGVTQTLADNPQVSPASAALDAVADVARTLVTRDNALPMLGGMAALLAPEASPLVAMGLAGAGAGAGEAMNVGLDAITGRPQTEDPWTRIARESALALTGEGIGRGAVGLAERTVLAPGRSGVLTEVLPTAREMREAAPPITLRGSNMWNVGIDAGRAPVRPSAVSQAKVVQWIDKIAHRNRVGRDELLTQDAYARNDIVMRLHEQVLTDAASQLPNGPGDLLEASIGSLAARTQAENLNIARAPAVAIYEGIRDIMGGTARDLPSTSPAALAGFDPSTPTTLSRVGRRTFVAGGSVLDFDNLVKRPLTDVIHHVTTQGAAGSTGYAPLDAFIKNNLAGQQRELKAFTDVWDMRTKLRTIMRGSHIVSDNKAVLNSVEHFGSRIDETLTGALDATMRSSPYPQLADWMRTADRIYAGEGHEYAPIMVRRLMQLTDDTHAGFAEQLVDRIFGLTGGQPPMKREALEQLRSALRRPDPANLAGYEVPIPPDPGAYEELQSWYVRNLLSRSVNDGRFDGSKLRSILDGEQSHEWNRLATVLDDRPGTIENLQRLARLDEFRETQGRSALNKAVGMMVTPDGGIGISLRNGAFAGGSAGATIGTVAGGPLGGAVGAGLGAGAGAASAALGHIVLGGKYASWVAGKLMTNPTSARWLAEGLSAPAGSRKAMGAVARLLAQSANLERMAEYKDRMREAITAQARDAYMQIPEPMRPALQPVE